LTLVSIALALDEASQLKLPSFGELIIKSIIAVVIVSLVIVFFFWYIRGFLRRVGGSELIKVIDRVYLDTRRFLCVVKVGERYFLLGVGEGGINFIAELEKVASTEGEEVAFKSSFRKQLEKLLGKRD